MRVFPMAPLPDADHAISASDPEVVALYSRYGGLFTAMRGAKWLLKPHALNVSAGGSVLANAFELPHAPGKASLWVLALGGNQSSAELSVAHLAAGVSSAGFEVLHPRHIPLPKLPTPAATLPCKSAPQLTFTVSRTIDIRQRSSGLSQPECARRRADQSQAPSRCARLRVPRVA